MDIWESLVFQRAAFRDSKSSSVMVMAENGALHLIPRDELDKLFYSISGWHHKSNDEESEGLELLSQEQQNPPV